MRSFAQIFLLITLVGVFFIFQNCGDVQLERPNRLEASSVSLGSVKPALAVRAFACLSCHAKITGDLITDFGYGDPFFFGLDKKENHDDDKYGPFLSSYGYWSDLNASWSTAAISGDVIIPKVKITDSRLIQAHTASGTGNSPTVSSLTLAKFITKPFQFPSDIEQIVHKDNAGRIGRFLKKETSPDLNLPGYRGQVKQFSKVMIGAPTESDIESLTELDGVRKELTRVGVGIYSADKGVRIRNLILKQGSVSRKFYVTNNAEVFCAGDVIIKGTLFLNNATIITDDGGCRLYVSQSVFVQGNINVQGSSDANLQITSSRAIIIGMKSLSSRLAYDYSKGVTHGISPAPTDTQELIWNQRVIEDRNKLDGLIDDAGPYLVRRLVGTDEPISIMSDFDTKVFEFLPGIPESKKLTDCGEYFWTKEESIGEGKLCYNDWAKTFQRKSFNMKHVFLNATKIHGRYIGTFEGVVVAENALFAVDHFEFKFDPVFSRVPILPLIGDQILFLQEN